MNDMIQKKPKRKAQNIQFVFSVSYRVVNICLSVARGTLGVPHAYRNTLVKENQIMIGIIMK
jgi:hypothetical protein